MNRTLNIAAILIGLTALIGIGLWMYGFPPPSDDPAKQASTVRKIVSFPLFWAGFATLVMGIIVTTKQRNFTGSKSDALPAAGILTIPAMCLLVQIMAPLAAYGIVSDVGVQAAVLVALAFFFLIVGNYIVTVAPDSRMGIRNRWTLSDPSVWTRTHRFFGNRLVVVTLLVTPVAFVIAPKIAPYVLIGAVLMLKGVTWLYARSLARQSAFQAKESIAS